MPSGDRQIKALTQDEALCKLAGAMVGRLLFTRRWLPAIRFANHLIDGGDLIVRGDREDIDALGVGDQDLGVAYESGEFDSVTGTGWSVTVIGPAELVIDPRRVAQYHQALRPWSASETSEMISIFPRSISGYEIIAMAGLPAPGSAVRRVRGQRPHRGGPHRRGT
jgi:hypothetical protein